jgi:hypothetical protein
MPLFRLAVEGPGQEKVFKLGKDWEQYSFIFHTDSSYSSALVTLDLLTAGTAWFDMIQITPDPLISYTIGKDRGAKISIATTVADAEIRYSLGIEKNAERNAVYSQPFLVSKTATLSAGLFAGDKEIAQANMFIPVNKATGKPVTLQTQYAPQYAGSGNSTLTDGAMGSSAFKDNRWLGFSGRDVIATIDMQEQSVIHSVAVNFLCDPNSGIFLPPRVSLYISDDGKNFRPAGTYINSNIARRGEPYLQSFVIGSKKRKARYVRVVTDAFGEIPEGYLFKGTMSWIFIDEIMVN